MDVSALFAAAARMDDWAGILRARAPHIGSAAATTHWYSPAARGYFAQIDEVTAQLFGCALRLSGLADRVRSYALVVRAVPP